MPQPRTKSWAIFSRPLRDYEGPNFHSSIDGSRRRGLGVARGHHWVRAGHSSRVLDLRSRRCLHTHDDLNEHGRQQRQGRSCATHRIAGRRATGCVGAFAAAADQLLCRGLQQRHSRRQRIRDRDRRSRLPAEVDRGDAVGQLRVVLHQSRCQFQDGQVHRGRGHDRVID